MDGLFNLVSIGGRLEITGGNALASLSGLAALRDARIGSLPELPADQLEAFQQQFRSRGYAGGSLVLAQRLFRNSSRSC